MPKRTDINSILIIGAGPIVIGQACEFDYSGTQAIKALKEEGYRIILVNSNPATIMTDPETADETYIEPITAETVAKIIAIEKPDAVLPTLGGQTGLNTALELFDQGVFERYGVEMIGATAEVIRKGFRPEIDSYSAFFENDHKTPTGLAEYLRGRGLKRVFLCGLATDFCVHYSALDAKDEGFETVVIEDACRAIDIEGSLDAAMAAMLGTGVDIIQSKEIVAIN